MKALYDLEDMIEVEIKKITKQSELDTTSVDLAYKLIDIMKDIETIMAMKNADYDSGYSRSDGVWDGASYTMRRYNGMRPYSRNGEHEHMIQRLERLMDETTDENVRRSIQKSINDLRA